VPFLAALSIQLPFYIKVAKKNLRPPYLCMYAAYAQTMAFLKVAPRPLYVHRSSP